MVSDIAVQYKPSIFFTQFSDDIAKVINKLTEADDFHLKLYYSNIISAMEKYLYDLCITEISTNKDTFMKMCTNDKFANQRYPLPVILHQDISVIIINSVKSMVWHRLNDIDPLFRKAMGIKMNIPQNLKKTLETRHHLVHRNGFDLDGNPVLLTTDEVNGAINLIKNFIIDIDKKFHTYKIENNTVIK